MEFHVEQNQDRVRSADDSERLLARRAIRAFARPRLTGSEQSRTVEVELRRRFVDLGYEVQSLPFRFSAWPGLYGVPAVGGFFLLGSLGAVALLLGGRGPAALGLLLATLAVLAFVGGVANRAIGGFPLGRREAENWLIHQPEARPRFLIVAHRDSKSQPLSTFMRVAAVALTAVSWLLLLVLATAAVLAPAWRWVPLIVGAAALALAGGGMLLFCRAGNDSPGALDNASGLAALVGIAARERTHCDVAFLVTDAEELGLAGARAIAGRLPRGLEVINLDGLDDEGPFHVIERFGIPRRGAAPHLAAALLAAGAALELDVERRDLPVGVLVDHIAFVGAGHPAVTLMRGTTRSLRRVHRPEDDTTRITGRGAAHAIALVSGALTMLRAGKSSPPPAV